MGCCTGDLKNKEVINVCSGKALGCVVDLEIDLCSGRIAALIVPGNTRIFSFSNKNDLRIPWDKVTRIGDDTVLVELHDEECYIRDNKPDKRR